MGGRRRIQTHRDREREAGGDAGESQSTKGNFESGLRGDQDSPRGPVAKGRIDRQKQEPHHVSGEHGGNSNPRTRRIGFLERVGFEETSWMDTRRFDGVIRQLEVGSTNTQQRSGSKEEETPRGDRDENSERCLNGRRLHGWSGWFRVETACGRENSGLSYVVADPLSLTVPSWNVAGLSDDAAGIFLSQIPMLTDWDVCCCKNVSGVWME